MRIFFFLCSLITNERLFFFPSDKSERSFFFFCLSDKKRNIFFSHRIKNAGLIFFLFTGQKLKCGSQKIILFESGLRYGKVWEPVAQNVRCSRSIPKHPIGAVRVRFYFLYTKLKIGREVMCWSDKTFLRFRHLS